MNRQLLLLLLFVPVTVMYVFSEDLGLSKDRLKIQIVKWENGSAG